MALNPYLIRQQPMQQVSDGVDVSVADEDMTGVPMMDDGHVLKIEMDDGSVEIDLNPQPEGADDDDEWFSNLAEKMDQSALGTISNDLLQGIEQDNQSRQQWIDTCARGLELLGYEIKTPTSDVGGSSAPLAGMANVRHPLLSEAVLRFQANARAELLPSDGPVKVRNDGAETAHSAQLASVLEEDLNHYLTVTASEYYPDTDRMLFSLGLYGCAFKKVYTCPLRRRPVSESVDATDIIVSNAATDLENAGRITHRVKMRPAVVKRMQIVGAYRDIQLGDPSGIGTDNAVETKSQQIAGVTPSTSLDPRDRDREIYECYCELDLLGFEHKMNGKPSGLPLPYKVTIDKDSREVLEIRRNYAEPGDNEEDDLCLPLPVFVQYTFVPAIGFYGIGLLHILGNMANAATASWREMLDAGMFANFPGFLIAKSLARQNTNELRVAPGSGVPVDTGGMPIGQAVMPLPYKGPDAALMQLTNDIVTTAGRVGGTAELQVAEGRQDAPVGTTLAMVEQATKIMSAVHKRLHTSQAREFKLLKGRFEEDPSALWRSNKRSKVLDAALVEAGQQQVVKADDQSDEYRNKQFMVALADCELVPAADPNTASQMERIMKATAVKQLQAANPALYNAKEVDTRILRALGWDDVEALFAPPMPPTGQPDPMTLMAQSQVIKAQTGEKKLGLDEKKLVIDAMKVQADNANKAADRDSKEKIAVLQVAAKAVEHSQNMPAVEEALNVTQFPQVI